jgi:hypothetical protein
MVELRWEGDDKDQFLFAGCNTNELAWLQKRTVQWDSTVWVPGIDIGKRYNTLAAHQKIIEEKVQHWFGLALTNTPAMDKQGEDQ